jgi:hypothetical protein
MNYFPENCSAQNQQRLLAVIPTEAGSTSKNMLGDTSQLCIPYTSLGAVRKM